LLAEQVAAFHPRVVALSDKSRIDEFEAQCKERGVRIPEIVLGESGLREIASASEVETVVSAAVGAAGLVPTYAAVRSGKRVALANKEAMVLAGELLRNTAKKARSTII